MGVQSAPPRSISAVSFALMSPLPASTASRNHVRSPLVAIWYTSPIFAGTARAGAAKANSEMSRKSDNKAK
ncbi:MAG: hypothetical protein Q4D58_01640 [Synergistaceae bacterium]|nr:hypothetical protein [Synergistaceae bacterium]